MKRSLFLLILCCLISLSTTAFAAKAIFEEVTTSDILRVNTSQKQFVLITDDNAEQLFYWSVETRFEKNGKPASDKDFFKVLSAPTGSHFRFEYRQLNGKNIVIRAVLERSAK